MSRWQESGVVDDSEDEEFDLSDHIVSPEPQPKRRKLSQTLNNNASVKHPSPPAADEQLDISDGGNQEYARNHARPEAENFHLDVDASRPRRKPGFLFERNKNLYDDYDGWMTATNVALHGVSTSKQPQPGSSLSNVAVGNTDVSRPRPDFNLPQIETRTDETMAMDDLRPLADLKGKSQNVTARVARAADRNPAVGRPPRAALEIENDFPGIDGVVPRDVHSVPLNLDDDSSGLSSPLSERALSPVLFAITHGTDSNLPGNRSYPPSPMLVTNELISPHVAFNETNAQRHRTFRARKEKQLHPYLFDKAQYEQQWRSRGLRPVNFRIFEKPAHEAQDESFSEGPSQNQEHISAFTSSPPVPRQPLTFAPTGELASDDSLPDVHPLVPPSRLVSGVDGAHKSRKLGHLKQPIRPTGASRNLRVEVVIPSPSADEFAIPPSPPLTSSDSVRTSTRKPVAKRFRLPGQTPSHLPSPQISSANRAHTNDNTRPLDPDEPSRPEASLRNTPSRSTQVHVIDSSDSSSSSENDSEIEHRRIRQERKRIRGVLPASWLKIDLQAQQKEPSSIRPPVTARVFARSPERSPTKSASAKGLAKRLGPKQFSTARTHHRIELSDEDSPSTQSSDVESGALRQTTIDAHTNTLNVTEVDDDRMETDWIDPMLAGSSRQRNISQPRKRKRQRRITETFDAHHFDFSEERKAQRLQNISNPKTRPKQSNSKRANRTGRSRPALPRLSIVDAARSPATIFRRPQFMKLAQRTARQRDDLGRHSPSHKWIRLATEAETLDANSTLHAWRAGTIAPVDSTEVQGASSSKTDGATAAPAFEIDDDRPALNAVDLKQTRSRISPLRASRILHKTAMLRRNMANGQSRLPNHGFARETSPEDTARLEQGLRSRRPRLLTRPIRYTGAQLEKLETSFNRDHRTAAFERKINSLSEIATRRSGANDMTQAPQMQRYLHDIEEAQPNRALQNEEPVQREVVVARPQQRPNGRIRKRPAYRVEVDTREYRQPSEPIPEPIDSVETSSDVGQSVSLQDLGGFGTRYATDFDIRPLPMGTFFHQSTFIGSGDFASSLQLRSRNFDVPSGRIRVYIEETVAELGVWTEDVASAIARIPRVMAANLTVHHASDQSEQPDILQANMEHMLRSIVRYCSNCLSYLDPVDRRDCVISLRRFVEDILDNLPAPRPSQLHTDSLHVLCRQYTLVITKQVLQICDHELISADTRERVVALFNRCALDLARTVLPSRLNELRLFLEGIRKTSRRESGIRHDDLEIATLVILNHCLYDAASHESSFWEIVNSCLQPQVRELYSVVAFDTLWYDIFSLLPALEIDFEGVARVGTRYSKAQDNWNLVRQLVDQVLTLYGGTATANNSALNNYVRAILTRCHRLVSRWGWWKAESVLGLIYDFFARRGLEQLEHEETKGVPSFLENLERGPSFEIEEGDRSFVIFLKTLATNLLNLRKYGLYNDKKLGGIAFRFIPNHGRTHRKDMDMKRTELDALRNHYDLLSTLYYATPPGHRPGIYLLRTVADIPNSHREVCRHCVRSWATLLSFQASTSEPLETLYPLLEWGREILQGFLSQYQLARSEAEQDFEATKSRGIIGITEVMLTTTITSNQRQIVAMMVDALAGLRRALFAARTQIVAAALIKHLDVWALFIPFKSSERRLVPALEMALDVTKTAFDVHLKFDAIPGVESEDSQDYGDSSALELFAEAENPNLPIPDNIVSMLHEPLGRLVSNVFGDDESAEDGLLTKILVVWVQVAGMTMRKGDQTWMSYVDDYSPVAWNQLRETDQKHKFTPFFLSCVVNTAKDASEELKATVITSWLVSLVEREAALKYQHKLTESLLNNGWDDELAQNLPFIRNSKTLLYNITLQEIRQRRLAVISTVLSNIRKSFEDAVHHQPRQVLERRKMYQLMLKKLMQAMKANYSELSGTHNVRADANVQGAYVEFVQEIVTFLQQYTTDICRVDTFFTDSSAFPLPVKDPAYVVGRLRSYTPKLAESKTRKQLATFVHTVSERAALDGQQAYLVDQLASAVDGMLERGSHPAPSLRHVLLTAIFPAYVEHAMDGRCSWVLAIPILQAIDRILSHLQYDTKMDEPSGVAAMVEIMTCTIKSFTRPLRAVSISMEMMQWPSTLQTLSRIFSAARSSVTMAHYLERTGAPGGDALMQSLSALKRAAQSLSEWTVSRDGAALAFDLDQLVDDHVWADTKAFAAKQTLHSIANSWAVVEGRLLVRRGNAPKEVVVHLGGVEEEGRKLEEALAAFLHCYESVIEGGLDGRSVESLRESLADMDI